MGAEEVGEVIVIHQWCEGTIPTRAVIEEGYLRLQQEIRKEWRTVMLNRIDATNALEAVCAELLRAKAALTRLEKEKLARLNVGEEQAMSTGPLIECPPSAACDRIESTLRLAAEFVQAAGRAGLATASNYGVLDLLTGKLQLSDSEPVLRRLTS